MATSYELLDIGYELLAMIFWQRYFGYELQALSFRQWMFSNELAANGLGQ